VDLLKTGKVDVRHAAAVALGRMGDSRAIETLRKVRERVPQAFAREAAGSALRRLDADSPPRRLDWI
jgi:HEAT repeat protein